MKQTNENIIIQLASPERKFVKVYQDFLQNELLTAEEKIVFIVLKSFVDFKTDSNSVQGEAYPTMETVCRLSSLSKPRATKAINKLIEKKIVRKIRRGLTKSNIYTLSDYAAMWTCDNIKYMTETAQTEPLPAKAGRFGGLLKQPKVVSIQSYTLHTRFILSRSYRKCSFPANPGF